MNFVCPMAALWAGRLAWRCTGWLAGRAQTTNAKKLVADQKGLKEAMQPDLFSPSWPAYS